MPCTLNVVYIMKRKSIEWKIKLGPHVLQFRISVPDEFENQKIRNSLKISACGLTNY